PQGGDLIRHQRNQRRHHNGDTRPYQCRNLVAQRLASARRHQDKAVSTTNDMLDDFALLPAKFTVTEDRFQNRLCGFHTHNAMNADSSANRQSTLVEASRASSATCRLHFCSRSAPRLVAAVASPASSGSVFSVVTRLA